MHHRSCSRLEGEIPVSLAGLPGSFAAVAVVAERWVSAGITVAFGQRKKVGARHSDAAAALSYEGAAAALANVWTVVNEVASVAGFVASHAAAAAAVEEGIGFVLSSHALPA